MDGSRIYIPIMHTWYNVFGVQLESCVPATSRFIDSNKNSNLIYNENRICIICQAPRRRPPS